MRLFNAIRVFIAMMWPTSLLAAPVIQQSFDSVPGIAWLVVSLLSTLGGATCAHRKQVRKYTNEPYINHCLEVAGLVCDLGGTHSPDMVKAAWLHDTIEDTDVTADEIYEVFGRNVWRLVLGLTDSAPLSLGNRAKRKAYERDRLAAESSDVQTIKCCDLISNTRSIVQYDPEFAKVYLVEKRNLLEVMTRASGAARSHAFDVLKQAEEALKIGGR